MFNLYSPDPTPEISLEPEKWIKHCCTLLKQQSSETTNMFSILIYCILLQPLYPQNQQQIRS